MTDTSDPSGRRRFLGVSLGATTALLAGWRPWPASALGVSDRIRVGAPDHWHKTMTLEAIDRFH